MIQPKKLNVLLAQCLQEFSVQSIFITTNDGQAISHAGQTARQLTQFSTLSVLYDDCREIGRIVQKDEAALLEYAFIELDDSQTILSNFQDLFLIGITSYEQNTGVLVQYMHKLHGYIKERMIN